VGGNEGVDGDVSGEEAAWRDLIARFDLPVDTTTRQAPWPAREDLAETSRDRQRPERDPAVGREQGGPAGPGGPVSRAGPASLPGPAGIPGPVRLPGAGLPATPGRPRQDRPDDSGRGTPGRDGTGQDGSGQADAGLAGRGQGSPGQASPGPAGPGPAGTGQQDVGAGPGGAGGPAGPDAAGTGREGRAGRAAADGFPGDRAHIVRRAEPIPRPAPAGDDADEDGRYVPPPPGPLPQLDPVARGAWVALLGGPGYLLIATLIGWQVSDWAALVAIIAFVGGFATLVLRMSDGPRDDDDDGAVV